MGLTGIDHVNIDTWSVDATVSFYADVLGLESRAKPSGNPGVWLYLGEQALVHVNPVDADGATSTGLFNHIAFNADDFDDMCRRLNAASHDYRSSKQPDLGRAQIFVVDPNGIMVEITCPCPT